MSGAAARGWVREYRGSAEVRAVIRQSLAVAAATSLYGVSFGALAVASGLSIGQACVLSLLLFSGGSQFALIGVLASGGIASGAPATLGSTLLGARNAVYGMRMRQIIGGSFWRRLAAAWITIDESTAVALAQRTRRLQRVGFWVTGIGIYLGWNLSSALGAVIGDLLGDTRAFGLDAAAAAAFLALLWPRLKNLETVAVAVSAALLAVLLTPALPPGLPIIGAALLAVLLGLAGWRADGGVRRVRGRVRP
ncbi:AzlC family ABC transporter permease [Mycetocola spongiae]|uniref:AzlC family ABC transporter permease n=1 Tax=Mycetocola spongiae TaxID=2859226 RepID=UPI001CF3AC7E|nr:AzlC family ABC transporter permease [Mycetocola spongiae]UCR89027.1 AzlC family ABC transporter permease [Mycetocola spongiae]